MKRNEKGFTFIEAVISLNLITIFCTLIVPSLILLLQKKENLILMKTADDILTDAVHLYFLNREEFFEGDVIRNGQVYTISLDNKRFNQICVTWINRSKESETCENISE